jgi:hypothetical protein
LAKLNLTRQSSALASPPKELIAYVMSPIASPASGKFMDLIALIGLSDVNALESALPNRPADPIALEAEPIALDDAEIAEFKSIAII